MSLGLQRRPQRLASFFSSLFEGDGHWREGRSASPLSSSVCSKEMVPGEKAVAPRLSLLQSARRRFGSLPLQRRPRRLASCREGRGASRLSSGRPERVSPLSSPSHWGDLSHKVLARLNGSELHLAPSCLVPCIIEGPAQLRGAFLFSIIPATSEASCYRFEGPLMLQQQTLSRLIKNRPHPSS